LWSFLELFFPAMAADLDRASVEFLDKQIFTDITAGEQHEADLVVKARWRGEPSFFLFHIEPQSGWRSVFPRRMFIYFSRLYEQYGVPVYPIAVLTYDQPLAEAPAEHRVSFPDGDVMAFQYRVVQLNRLAWRDFARRDNPVATALMAKMRIAPEDRRAVKLECLRLLLTLRLDRAKMGLIAGFVNTYLRLPPPDEQWVNEEMEAIDPGSKERMMFWTQWHEEGLQQGMQQGMQQGLELGRQDEALGFVKRLARRRLGAVAEAQTDRFARLSRAQLEELGDALLDFSSVADLERWLDRAAAQSRELS